MKKKIALTLGSLNGQCQEVIQQARAAEQLGYNAVWFGDTGFPDPLTLAGQVIAATRDIEVGIAVVPAYTRTPAVLASSTATLNQLSQGRFIMGLGSSSQTMIENWHGLDFDKPLTRVRETVALMRSMLAGEKSGFDGETLHSHGFRIPPVEQPQRIYLAALRPKMLETAAEIANGIVLNLYPQRALPKILEHIEIGAARAGKTLEDIDIVTRFQVAVTDNPENEIQLFRNIYAPYFATPVYNKYLAWAGYADVAAEIAAGWAEKNRERTTGALSDELIKEISVTGSMQDCHERIRADLSNGITTAMVTTVSGSAAVMDNTMRAFGKDHFPL